MIKIQTKFDFFSSVACAISQLSEKGEYVFKEKANILSQLMLQ